MRELLDDNKLSKDIKSMVLESFRTGNPLDLSVVGFLAKHFKGSFPEKHTVFDGFPRSVEQVNYINEIANIISGGDEVIIRGISIDASDVKIMGRIGKRKDDSGKIRKDDSSKHMVLSRIQSYYVYTVPAIEIFSRKFPITYLDANIQLRGQINKVLAGIDVR